MRKYKGVFKEINKENGEKNRSDEIKQTNLDCKVGKKRN